MPSFVMLRSSLYIALPYITLTLASGWLVSVSASADDEPVRFSREILPILSDRCFHCHGPDQAVREADVRLDLRESAIGEDGSTRVIVPGDAAASELLARISSDDPDLLMPPPDSGRPALTPDEVESFRRWIKQGATWGQHWSFEKPVRPEPPAAGRSPIDAFVEQGLEQVGLKLSPRASRRTLIRRLSLDLTGLPPTPTQVEAFLADTADDAYEKLVDRLLASPHYGERMAWPWLDAARYADSSGYQGDPERTMWPWRDWVVQALNDNMPFDQFTIEQLAGDLLPQPTPEQLLATGFNRNHMHNSEGGRIAEETRVENVFDRTETTGTVWLGLTLNCARCHDHKYDPTSQDDYFRFFDFFNQTTEEGRVDQSTAVPPAMDYVSAQVRAELEKIQRTISELSDRLTADDPEADQQQAHWERKFLEEHPGSWSVLTADSLKSEQGSTLKQRPDGAIQVTGKRPPNDVYVLELKSERKELRTLRLDALIDPDTPAQGTGRGDNGNFVLSEIEVEALEAGAEDADWKPVALAAARADFSQGNLTIDTAIDGKVDPEDGWAVSGHTIKAPRWAVVQLASPLQFDGGIQLRIRLRFESKHAGHTMALFRLSGSARDELRDGNFNPDPELLAIVRRPATERTAEETTRLRRHFRTRFHPAYQTLTQQLAATEKQRNEIQSGSSAVKVMVMDTRPQPRETFVLVKGIYNDRTDRTVTAGVPSMLPPLVGRQPGQRPDRLDLARWIVSPDNPLTARVTVNRFWQTFFGRGLVETPNDFGLQGQQPTHPELLDWLAVEFVESGWDVKHLHKLIVMSETYQQSAEVTPRQLEIDPENRWWGRSPRYRLPSWMIRDQALAASGLLQPQLGGSPVRPYQPPGVWAEATFGNKRYQMDQGDKLYRRSIYTFWRRIIGPTMFFDAAKRQTCEVKPSRTNTPLHALTVLNDTTFVEAARVLARHAMTRKETLRGELELVFARLCCRPPSEQELDLLEKSYARIRKQYAGEPEEARKLLTVGEIPRDETLDPIEHATLTTLVNMLMNLDEVLVRP